MNTRRGSLPIRDGTEEWAHPGGFGSWGLQAALSTRQAPPLAGTSPVLTHLPPRPGAPASSYPAAASLLAAPTFSRVFLGPLRNEGDVPPSLGVAAWSEDRHSVLHRQTSTLSPISPPPSCVFTPSGGRARHRQDIKYLRERGSSLSHPRIKEYRARCFTVET